MCVGIHRMLQRPVHDNKTLGAGSQCCRKTGSKPTRFETAIKDLDANLFHVLRVPARMSLSEQSLGLF